MTSPFKDEIDWDVAQSELIPAGTRVKNTDFHRDPQGTDARAVIMTGIGHPDGNLEALLVNEGKLTGFKSDKDKNFIYYVRGVDEGSMNFVTGSISKPKKIVTFRSTDQNGDMADVTTFKYQNGAFPVKVTSIQDFKEPVDIYLPGYDANSATQNLVP